jgi:hypothetical protein
VRRYPASTRLETSSAARYGGRSCLRWPETPRDGSVFQLARAVSAAIQRARHDWSRHAPGTPGTTPQASTARRRAGPDQHSRPVTLPGSATGGTHRNQPPQRQQRAQAVQQRQVLLCRLGSPKPGSSPIGRDPGGGGRRQRPPSSPCHALNHAALIRVFRMPCSAPFPGCDQHGARPLPTTPAISASSRKADAVDDRGVISSASRHQRRYRPRSGIRCRSSRARSTGITRRRSPPRAPNRAGRAESLTSQIEHAGAIGQPSLGVGRAASMPA